jgi:hypothetical protein
MPTLGARTDSTPITWAASGGTRLITLASLPTGAGQIGQQYAKGAGVQADRYRWRFRFKLPTIATLGRGAILYLATAHDAATAVDGDLGQVDAAVPTRDRVRNLVTVGVVQVDEVNASRFFTGSGVIDIPAAYFSPVVWNDTGVAFSATATDMALSFTPVAPETM